MERLLKAKHWQIFILLLIALVVGNIQIENAPTINAFLTIFGIIIYTMHPLAIGYFLQDYLPKKVTLNHNLFVINVFVWIATYSVIMILSDGQGMTFDGLIALPFFYLFYAVIHSIYFPAKTLKSIELGKKATIGDCLGDFFLIVFLPIGIWFLQPRVNKIIEMEHSLNDESLTA